MTQSDFSHPSVNNLPHLRIYDSSYSRVTFGLPGARQFTSTNVDINRWERPIAFIGITFRCPWEPESPRAQLPVYTHKSGIYWRFQRGNGISSEKLRCPLAGACRSVSEVRFWLPLGARNSTVILPINQGFRCPSGRATDFSGSNRELRLLDPLPAVYWSFFRCPWEPKGWGTLPFPHMDFRRPGATEFSDGNAVSRLPEASSTFQRQDSPCPSGGATNFSGSTQYYACWSRLYRFYAGHGVAPPLI